jgi:hypothetical protein
VVDAASQIGTLRSYQGVNGPGQPVFPDLHNVEAEYRELGVDLVRLHDLTGLADIDADFRNPPVSWETVVTPELRGEASDRSMFPDWSRDPEDPASYNFGPTDEFINRIIANGAEIYFRIGRSIGSNATPPSDPVKYAQIARNVVRHYNHGWAAGFEHGIRYWSVWNEPDVGALFWDGPSEGYYALYRETARALKGLDPTLKVGGPETCTNNDASGLRDSFVRFCRAEGLPLDFWAFHWYPFKSNDPMVFGQLADGFRSLLDANGYPDAEIHITEWNYEIIPNRDPDVSPESIIVPGSDEHRAAFLAASMSYFQDSAIDKSMFYRGDARHELGLFRHGAFTKPARAFQAMGSLQGTPARLEVSGGDDQGFAVLAGAGVEQDEIRVLITNYEIPEEHRGPLPENFEFYWFENQDPTTAGAPFLLPARRDVAYADNRGYDLTIENVPWPQSVVEIHRIDAAHDLEPVASSTRQGATIRLSGELPPPGIDLVVIRRR